MTLLQSLSQKCLTQVIKDHQTTTTFQYGDDRNDVDQNFVRFQHFSAYQIIILKVSDCVQELPKDFHLKLKDLNDENLNFHPFYIAAEIENYPVHEKSWKFTIGDGKSYGTFINKELRKGGNYFAYQRAITRFNGVSKFGCCLIVL